MNATLVRLTRLSADSARVPDGQLLAAFLAGSQPAFRELVTRHGPLVLAVCDRVLRHRPDAEDAFQAVFLVLARRAADVWPREAVGSWLYGVAHRVALKARSARARRRNRERPLEDVARPPPPLPEPDLAEVIDRALRRLPEAYRAAVVACDLEGLSRAEAAERLGWKEGTLSGRLARARQLLARRLRGSGLELPAALAGVLGTNAAVRAGLADSVVELVSGDAAGVSGPVAALAEGVVPSMFAFKMKAAVAAVAVACGLGYGAWAGGTGDGPGGAPAPADKPPAAAPPVLEPPDRAAPGPRLGLARDEAIVLLQELRLAHEAQLKGKLDPDTVGRLKSRLQAIEKLLEHGGKVPAAKPPEQTPAALEPFQGRWRIAAIADEKSTTAAGKGEDFGEFEIAGNVLAMPYRDASGGRKWEEYKLAVGDAEARTINLIAANQPLARGIYEFTAPSTTCTRCHDNPFPHRRPLPEVLPVCGPGLKVRTGLKLAIATAGPRPTKFGSRDAGVIEFTLERVAGERKPAQPGDEVAEARLAVEAAREQLRGAEAWAAQARAQVEVANHAFALAGRNLQAAQAQLEQAEKAAAQAKKDGPAPGAKGGDTFTVHVRPLAAAEKAIRVKATGKETVLEGLAHAAEDMAIKADALSVWVVRGKDVLPVDLAAITRNGDTATNHVLKPGDQLFVQVKVGK